MLKSRTIIIACLLLLVPTLLLGLGAFQLLQEQEQRLLGRSQATANDRALAIAGNIDLVIGEVQGGLLQTLQKLPQDQIIKALEAWKRSNPLVRNVFIWQSDTGLLHPRPDQPSSDEEASFVRRYQGLFDRNSWTGPKADQPLPAAQVSSSDLYQERQNLRSLAAESPLIAVAEPMAKKTAPATLSPRQHGGESGWRHWFADNHLHLIGWFEPAGSGQRIGLEIEMMGLLGRLLSNIPANPPPGESYRLIDGNAEIFHQSGDLHNTDHASELANVGLASLPHWRLVILGDNRTTTGGSFLLIAALLVSSFIVCILAGGGLLLWQVWRNSREAMQKTSFVSNVSHELKTPLTTIRMYAEMINEQQHLDQRTGNYLQIIVKESQRLTRLVNNVLDFSHLEQGRKSYRRDPLDLLELLQHLLDNHLLRIEEAGMRLIRQLPEGPVQINSDRDSLEQIILNLLDNAIKYAVDGREIRVALSNQNACWQLEVCDRGPGIAKGQLVRVFEKFHRVDNSLTTRQQGSGLGLSIARQLAEGLGGELSCQNLQSGGACFTLKLPKGAKS